MRRVLAAAWIGLALPGGSALAQDTFVGRSAASMRDLDAVAPGASLRTACAEQIEASFDLPAMARAVAGLDIWDRLGAARQPAFIAALRARLATECTHRQRGGTLTPLATRQTAAGVSLTVRLTLPDGGERILVWRLHEGGPWGWRASDLVVDGISAAAALRDEVRAGVEAADGDVAAAIPALSRGAPPP
ncbi:ABC transporter substrate-binding protein [Roseomonas sp. CAU 1739]|uniref:ABC transporter substrate-binding protein n=1 Tax=Roseomonas sp. CAU 1739 TaxID=3140364 RepID=UPI00325C02F4